MTYVHSSRVQSHQNSIQQKLKRFESQILIKKYLFIIFQEYYKMGGKYWTDVINQRGTKIKQSDYPNLSQENKIPYDRLRRAWRSNGRVHVNIGHTCGLNALNMANKILGYSHQWDQGSYPYTYIINPVLLIPGVNFIASFFIQQPWIKWGYHSKEFGLKLITPYYENSDWQAGDNMPWNIIDGTNFKEEVVIVLVQWDVSLHYILLIGADDEKKGYITTDQSQQLHWISRNTLINLMTIFIPGVRSYCAYRVG